MKSTRHIPLSCYDTDYVEIPSRPDIDRLVVVPLKTVFINFSAEPGANVTYLVHDLDESLGFLIQRNRW